MNWAGYYSDDFNKIKKGKDRFNASNNNLGNPIMGAYCDFFITSDKALLMKAIACYSYLNLRVEVVSPSEFIKKRCVFNKDNITVDIIHGNNDNASRG